MNLFPVLTWSIAEPSRWAEVGWFLARLTLVAGLGHLMVAALPRASASRRHLVAVATLAALVALPFAVALLPAWRLAILPAARRAVLEEPRTSGVGSRPAPRRASTLPSRVTVATRAARPAHAPVTTSPARSTARSIVTPVTTGTRASAALASPQRPARAGRPINWVSLMLLVAVGGAALSLVRIIVSMARAAHLGDRAQPVDDAANLSAFVWACERMGVRSAVRVARSSEVSVPIVAGIVRPVLLLPAASSGWTPERLRIVYLHELAHVRRGDAASLLLGRLATALFWYHPLVWSLAREARRESEQACDDMVLASGVRASEYADQLLRIGAMGAGRDRFAAATLAVARRSSLEVRLLSILSADARRGPASRSAVAVATVVAACVLVPIVSVRVVAAPPLSPSTTTTGAMRTTGAVQGSTVTTMHTTTGYSYSYAYSGGSPASGKAAVTSSQAEACSQAQGEACAKACEEARTAAAKVTRATADAEFAGYKSGDGLFSQAREMYGAKRYDEAGETYREAGLAGYRPAISFYNAACSYALDSQRDLALSALAEARDAGFDDVALLSSDSDLNSIRADHRFQLIVLAIRHTDKAEAEMRSAEGQYRALEKAGSKDAGAWKSLGMTLMRSGDPALAADAFERQHQIDGSPSAIYNQACAFALNRERDKALDALERAIGAGFGDDRQVAEDADLASLHDAPRFAQLVQLTRDLALYSNGIDDDDPATWRAALPRFERVAREHPQVGRAWFNLGYARLKTGDLPGSREGFTRALELGHRPSTTMYNLACVAAQAHDADAAMQWLQKAESAGMEMENTIPNDKDLDPLRSDPRFKAMVQRVKDQMTEKKHAAKD